MESRPLPLSNRQFQCLSGVARHLDSHQIGHEIGISPHTVDGHIAQAVKKLGARSRRDALVILETEYGHSFTGGFPPLAPDQTPPHQPDQPPSVQEDRTSFDTAMELERSDIDERRIRLTALQIVWGAVALLIFILGMRGLWQSAADLANLISPHR